MGHQSEDLIYPNCAAHMIILTHTAPCDINEDAESKGNRMLKSEKMHEDVNTGVQILSYFQPSVPIRWAISSSFCFK
jgi:hypothetical protein